MLRAVIAATKRAPPVRAAPMGLPRLSKAAACTGPAPAHSARTTAFGAAPFRTISFRGRSVSSLQFLGRHATVAIGVVAREKWTWLVSEFLAAKPLIVIVVEVGNFRVGKNWFDLSELLKFLGIKKAIRVLVGQCEKPAGVLLPFLASEDAVVVRVPSGCSGHERIRRCWLPAWHAPWRWSLSVSECAVESKQKGERAGRS
jgi:hypothetical protein